MVDAICRDSARWIELPASPPNVRTAADVTEAFLARLDGSAFDAPLRIAGKLVERADDWARSVTSGHAALIVRLDPPDRGDAWNLAVFAPGDQGALVPAEHAIVNGGPNRRTLEDEMTRLERMVPALRRPGGTRRGQVVLSQDEAWELMAITGPRLAAAGFDVRIPELSPHRPAPMLRVFAEASASSVVGASQLADVRWSAVFDDVELTAADIAKLAKEARPLIRSGGRWVAIDRADLNAAAAALAERAVDDAAVGRGHVAPRPRSRGIAARGRDLRGGWRLGRRPPGHRGEPLRRTGRRTRRVRRRSAQLPGRGARVARLPRLRRPRWLPGPRHGARQDAHDARARARGRRATAPRW